MRKVYIAGPMRGIPYFNFPEFDAVAHTLRNRGVHVLSPADLDREVGFDALDLPSDWDWDQIPDNFDFDACMKRDVDAVMEADGIYLLDGWEKSRGAVAEVALARWRELPVFCGSFQSLTTWKDMFGEDAPFSVWREFCQCSLDDVLIDEFYHSCCKCTEDTPEVVYSKELGDYMKDTNPKDAIGSRKAKLLSVIPGNVLFDLGLALTEGMVKYGRHNYRIYGVRASVYVDAAMGHLVDWWEGQDIDPDSGLNHVTKSIASLVVLRDAMMQGMLTDDRPPSARHYKQDFNDMACAIMDRHADKNPKHYTRGDKPDDTAQG